MKGCEVIVLAHSLHGCQYSSHSAKGNHRTRMNKTYRVILFSNILLFTFAAWASGPQFTIKESHKDSNGVTLKNAAGTMRIEACGDRIIHVVASPTAEIPAPKVP